MAQAPAPADDDIEQLLQAQPQFLQEPTDQHGKRRQGGPIAIGFEGAFAGLKDQTGTVREWVEKGGYGFIKPDNEQLPDLFVHRTSMVGEASAFATGDRVTFDTAQDLKSGRLRAENVRGGSGIGHKDTRSYKKRTAEEANLAEASDAPKWLQEKAEKEKAKRDGATVDYSDQKDEDEMEPWEFLQKRQREAMKAQAAAAAAASGGGFVSFDDFGKNDEGGG